MKKTVIFFLISFLILPFISQIQSNEEKADAGSDDDGKPELLTMLDSDAGEIPPLKPITDLFEPFLPAGGPGPDNPTVPKLCEATENPDLCSETVKPYIEKQPEIAGDAFALLEIEIRLVYEATQRALSASINPKTPDVVVLKHCKDVYVDALRNLRSALDAIPMKDIVTMKTKLSAAMKDLDTCDEGFEKRDEKLPIGKYGSKLNKMLGNCLSLASNIDFAGVKVDVNAGAGDGTDDGRKDEV